jgi:hypothetical protein
MSDLQPPVRWLDDSDADEELRLDLAHTTSAPATGIDYGALLNTLRDAIAQEHELPAAAASGSGFRR